VLVIQNVTLLTPFEQAGPTDVAIDAGRIHAIGKGLHIPSSQSLDASGLLLVPGLVELQINGAFGMDFTSDPACIWSVAARLPCYGVTSFLPTIVTSPLETIAAAQSVVLGGAPAGFHGAIPLGLHVEGPFLNPERKGAHREEYLRPPSAQEYAGLARDQGVRLATLAPELPGALAVVAGLVERGVVVSAGHSMATLEQARQAFAGGVSYGTHLFNAMSPLHQFDPGLPGALLAEPGMRFGLIPDGIHVHPTLVDLVWKLSGPGRMTLVTDAMAALGMPPGVYQLGDKQAVYVDGASARLSNGNLAGSILPHDAALRNLMAFTGCSLGEALTCLTSTPAALLGLADEIGQVAPGRRADLALLTPDLHVAKTLVAGEIVYERAAKPAD
jgi:N-acetylglucosamine-6-phosphate deacetylase